MEIKNDAQRIGVELQNLLKIPPINKVNRRIPGPGDGTADNLNTFRLEKMILSDDSGARPPAKEKATRQPRTEERLPFDAQIPAPVVAPKPQRITSKNDFFDSHDVNHVQPVQPPVPNVTKIHSSPEDLNLFYILRRSECPRDLQLESEALMNFASKERNGGQITPTVKSLLTDHHVDLLSKKSSKFPKAKYFCGHCNYHMDTISACVTHVMGTRHASFEQMRKLEYTLTNIPNPSQSHSLTLGHFLASIMNQYGIPETERERRRAYINKLNEDLKNANIGCCLSLYGSSYTGLGFKDSDLNVNVIMSDNDSCQGTATKSATTIAAENADMLQKLFLFLQHHSGSSEVKKLVTSKSAKIHLRENGGMCEVVLSLNNNAGVETAKLLAEYCKLCPLAGLLTIGLRVWAKYCEIDNQDKGCLPPHAYSIMVIYYLQQKGLLPHLHMLHETYTKKSLDKESRSYATAEEASAYRKSLTKNDLGYHWLRLLYFYAIEFNYKESVISISHQNVLRAEKYWNRKISIEDPVIPKSNLSRCMSNNRMCDYILERLKFTYFYFGIPRTIRGPIYNGIVAPENTASCVPTIFHRMIPANQLARGSERVPTVGVTNRKWDPQNMTEEIIAVKYRGKVNFPAFEVIPVKLRLHEYTDNDHKLRTDILVDDVVAADNIFCEWLYEYKFDTQTLQNGLKPPVVCKSCGAEGHFRSDCPDEILPILRPVMNATPSSLRILNDVLIKNFEKETLNNYDIGVRKKIVAELERSLLPIYPDSILAMFGSTHNGFGVHMSDVDVCLTFRNKSALKMEELVGDEETNAIVILRTIVERLKSAGFLQEVVAIPSAKVPIVKFRHRSTSLEGDISLYNTLAMYNTDLLRTYAELDPRVKIIGCFLKKLTKLCDISDASRGSLSSYGYVLMAVHYFQHTPIPILPVLQELCRDNLKPILIDGCDIQYFKDIKNLKFVWPYYGQNRQSVAELWLGFLNYYTETFNFEEHVITISQYKTLTRVYKFWLTDALAIEDPFDRTHNLGAGLSRRMSIHILKTFHHLRQVFHQSYDSSMLKKNKDWLIYFTDPKLLQNGNPPLDRQCRICHKIGHIAKNCSQNEKGEDVPAKKSDKTPTLLEVIEQVQGVRKSTVNATKPEMEDSLNDHSKFQSLDPTCILDTRDLVTRHAPEAQSPSCLSAQDAAFPHFFGVKQSDPDDEVLYRMIQSSSQSRTPGVEFVLSEELTSSSPVDCSTKIGNDLERLLLNAGEAFFNNNSQHCNSNGPLPGFGDPNLMRMRAFDGPSHPHGVTFMSPPNFQHIGIQYAMGNPNVAMQATTPPPPGFAPLPSLPIVSHPTYIHPHAIPSHPFPINIYPISLMNSTHHQHEVPHPAPSTMHPFPMFPPNMGPSIRPLTENSVPNGETHNFEHHGSPIMNGFQTDSDRVCLPTMSSFSPIMTPYTFPPQVAHFPRVPE